MPNATELARLEGTIPYTAAHHFHLVNAGWMSLSDFSDQHGRLIDTEMLRYLVDQFLERHDPECTRVFVFKDGACLYPAFLLKAILALDWTPKVDGPCLVSAAYHLLKLPDLSGLPDKLPISAESVGFFRSISEEARQFLFQQLTTQEWFAKACAPKAAPTITTGQEVV